MSSHLNLDVYNKSSERAPALFPPVRCCPVRCTQPKLSVVDPRVGCVQTAEGAGVFFLSTHLQGCRISITSAHLAFILIADNAEARQDRERRCWDGAKWAFSPSKVTSLPKNSVSTKSSTVIAVVQISRFSSDPFTRIFPLLSIFRNIS